MKLDRKIFSWALYDWANSAYATTVMVALFPIMFKDFWCKDMDPTQSTAKLGVISAVSCIIVAICAPVLGAIADRAGGRKLFLAIFTLLGVVATAFMAVAPEGNWQLASLLFLLGTIGFSGGLSFYDSLLLNVADEKQLDFVSGFGYSMGYIGGAILMTINVIMITSPEKFWISDKLAASQWSFISVAIWWLLFSLPLFFFVPEKITNKVPISTAAREGMKEFIKIFCNLPKYKPVMLFLLAYWFYIDGVDTIIRMATDYGRTLNLSKDDLIKAVLITNYIGFPAAIIYGWLGQKLGARPGIFFGIDIYICITFFAAFVQTPSHFYMLAIAVGLVQGGLQALSRSYYARLIPSDKQAEFFGLYNMLGKFAAFLGPLLVAGGAVLARNMGASPEKASRYGIFSVMILFVIGLIFFIYVKPENKNTAVK